MPFPLPRALDEARLVLVWRPPRSGRALLELPVAGAFSSVSSNDSSSAIVGRLFCRFELALPDNLAVLLWPVASRTGSELSPSSGKKRLSSPWFPALLPACCSSSVSSQFIFTCRLDMSLTYLRYHLLERSPYCKSFFVPLGNQERTFQRPSDPILRYHHDLPS